ncbi:MAG: HEPN domain-containing protein [Planctomycetes bacterium]|nr:HEPN domain-containing protein [Planctomycetota bacterium]
MVSLNDAKDELDMALYLLKGGYYKGSCYHAQQSMEKSIKACLLAKGWELEKIHNIERLLSIAGDFGISVNISEGLKRRSDGKRIKNHPGYLYMPHRGN